jgi:hypothetical protein
MGLDHFMTKHTTFWTNNMVDKLTLLFLSSELEMDDDDDEMKLKESVVNVAIVAA